MSNIIRRTAPVSGLVINHEKRDDGAEPSLKFRGHAIVFNQPALIGSTRFGFVEWIESGSAADAAARDDVRFLFNHDGMPLARTTNDTLKLKEDKIGLDVDADLADEVQVLVGGSSAHVGR